MTGGRIMALGLVALLAAGGLHLGGAVLSPAAALMSFDEPLPDATQEERARDIARNLRCVVCQNQSIDDSEAPLARDMRRLVRERIAAGASDDEVFDHITERYGDYVLMRPPFQPNTWALWLAPGAVALLAAGGIATMVVRRRRRAAGDDDPAALSAEEEAALARLLEEEDGPADTLGSPPGDRPAS